MPSVSNSNKYSPYDFYRRMGVDAFSGAFAGLVCYFFEGLKKRIQRGEISGRDFYNLENGKLIRILHPKEAFRGATSFAGSVALNATAGLTASKWIRGLPFYNESSEKHQLASAILGGNVGALFSTCAENTIVVQQEKMMGPKEALYYMFKQGPSRPFVGLRELMIRESGFIGSVLYFGPKVREVTLEKTESQSLATISAIGVGAAFATLTHPADTLATWRQKKEGKLSFIGGVKELYAQGGSRVFFRGVGARIFLFTGCFLILESLPGKINEMIDSDRNPKINDDGTS